MIKAFGFGTLVALGGLLVFLRYDLVGEVCTFLVPAYLSARSILSGGH